MGVAGIRDFVYVRTLKPLIERMWEYVFSRVCLFATLLTLAHQAPLSVHGISQARILEWVAISFPRGSSDPGIEVQSPVLLGRFFTPEIPGKPYREHGRE